MSILTRFFPNKFNIFDLYEKQISYAVEAAKYFREIVSKGTINAASLEKIHDLEHQGDDVAHEIIEQLNKTFITPFDREDIHSLAKEIDDIVDMINTLTGRLLLYKLTKVDKNLVEFAEMIEQSVVGVSCAIKGLRDTKNIQSVKDACVEVNRLENMGDTLRDKALTQLFETEKDAIAVIKWKEVYQEAETILDICEDVAHVVENIIVKQV
ncbi:MAG: hypothetical protein A3J83_02750 [Elusimicrobia bacterium RIFOXYA2_FULL_40_6]|nr:MAG: hypothetical protein A3J83_02750 [Elusimicrobia bacterium RIFOXYA2_FULL_40_6]